MVQSLVCVQNYVILVATIQYAYNAIQLQRIQINNAREVASEL